MKNIEIHGIGINFDRIEKYNSILIFLNKNIIVADYKLKNEKITYIGKKNRKYLFEVVKEIVNEDWN